MRKAALGAEVLAERTTRFRVWAPKRRRVEVIVAGGPTATLGAEDRGYFSGSVDGVGDGSRYRFRLDGGDAFPDPASRAQPDGPHGASQVIDPNRYDWGDAAWRGIKLAGQVVYELHVGTFTKEGTWAAAAEQLDELARFGITLVEMMPIAEFPGAFGWGYDGVDLYAPTRNYGEPDDLRRFVDRAHAAGVGVILDVVYNHLGPDGNYLAQYADEYFTEAHQTDWGPAINYGSAEVRAFAAENAAYWIREYHFDGLRLDATQCIADDSDDHILAELTRAARAAAADRSIVLIAENESQETKLVRAAPRGGYGLDALWNDDYHHAASVARTGRREAYYTDYGGTPQELVSAMKWGYLYQGQRSECQKRRRGMPAFDLPTAAFIAFLENHDQIASSARGRRIHQLTSPGKHRALTALTLLGPETPMLFQGQEFSASAPFLYFADHRPAFAELVKNGRLEFLAQFPSLATPEMQALLDDPSAPETFERCKLDFAERERHPEAYALHRDLLALRRKDAVVAGLTRERARAIEGAVLGPSALVLRYFGGTNGDRLLIVNLGKDLRLVPAPEPLLAPVAGVPWTMLWSSEHPRYGGSCALPVESAAGFAIPAESASLLGGRTSSCDDS